MSCRRTLPPDSPTRMTPAAVTARPCGVLNAAAVPNPLVVAERPEPASVETAPMGDMERTRWLPPSTTRTLPVARSTATEWGRLKAAAVPVASVHAAAPDPASAVVTPDRDTRRIRFPNDSATTALSDASTSTPFGKCIDANVPTPLTDVDAPSPASVVTLPSKVTTRMRLLRASATISEPSENCATSWAWLNAALVPTPSA